jgi:hypothetical protein
MVDRRTRQARGVGGARRDQVEREVEREEKAGYYAQGDGQREPDGRTQDPQLVKAAETEKPANKRRATWLHRDPSNASTSSETWEVVKPETTGTTSSSSSFWKLNLASSSPPAPTTSNVPASSAVVTTTAAPSAAPSSEGASSKTPNLSQTN